MNSYAPPKTVSKEKPGATASQAVAERPIRVNEPTAELNNSPRALQLKALAASLNARPQVAQLARWKEKLNRNRNPLQRVTANHTGLPETLKTGVESLSGLSMDDVKVHYNSPKPAQLESLAYTQGTEIHVAPGQEQHLAHEAWHVVQQKERRVQPTMQLQGTAINDDSSLEHEADVMARNAASSGPTMPVKFDIVDAEAFIRSSNSDRNGPLQTALRPTPVQRKIMVTNEDKHDWAQEQLQKIIGPWARVLVFVNDDGSVDLIGLQEDIEASPGAQLLVRLIESEKIVRISPHDGNEGGLTNYDDIGRASNPDPDKGGTDSEISIGKGTQKSLVRDAKGNLIEEDTPSWLILAHELIHADRAARGARKQAGLAPHAVTGNWRGKPLPANTEYWTRREEAETVGLIPGADITENAIRDYHNWPLVAIYETEYIDWIKKQFERKRNLKAGGEKYALDV